MRMQVKISFVEEGVSCLANFWPDKAPKTCQMLWDALAEGPFEGMCIHAMFTGRELSFPVEHTRLDPDISLNLPPENQIVFPIPGDLVWNAYQPYQWQGVPNPVYDFGIFYGRDARLLLPVDGARAPFSDILTKIWRSSPRWPPDAKVKAERNLRWSSSLE